MEASRRTPQKCIRVKNLSFAKSIFHWAKASIAYQKKVLGRKSKSYRPKDFFFYSLPQKDYLGHYIIVTSLVACFGLLNGFQLSYAKSDALPEIVAKTYHIQILRRSHTNRIYIFEDKTDPAPQVGETLLVKENNKPIMGFRVLKIYPDKGWFAVKRLRRYRKHAPLKVGESFTAVEKLTDIDSTDLDELDSPDLSDLETAKSPADPSPVPKKAADSEDDTTLSDDEDLTEIKEEQRAYTVTEGVLLDRSSHWITLGFGFVRNFNPPGMSGAHFFSSGNFRYGLTLGKLMFFKKHHAQDSIVLEGGFYLYKALSYISQGDSYTLVCPTANIRYNVFFSESFGIFFYGGIMRNQITSSNQGTAAGMALLQNILPTFGAGLLFQIGPGWYTRADLGMDSQSLNLLLKF